MNGREGLIYVYAAAPDTRRVRACLSDVRGVSEAPVLLLGEGAPGAPGQAVPPAVVFVISRVAANEFDERTLKDRFEDLEWLEGIARAHHEVVQAIARHDTVLPFRLATVYQNDERARRALVAQRDAFAARIALLSGHSEFGVKLYVPPAGPPEDGSVDDRSDDGSVLSPGKAYLRQRRAQHSVQESRYQRAQQVAERVEALASEFSTHRVRHPAQRGALAGPEENVLNDAYLVPDDRAEAFRAALTAVTREIYGVDEGQGPEGVRVEVTGPWAPYSFAMATPQPSPPSAPPVPTPPRPDESDEANESGSRSGGAP
ncbi:GvpL/GvpF family gas vesicle protein [Streptomyces sp. NPDC050842]|uniref:GvpL/GvpF family gas vesicle protein n=1 Tax=Streptomyces sp. NPDC050842 TaxID=3365636 RepID=UPI00379F5411